MKVNEAPDFPEKVYIPRDPEYPQSPDIWWERELSESNIEYIRTDAFIEKACEFLKSYRQDTLDGMGYIAGIINDKTIEDFINYMKGE